MTTSLHRARFGDVVRPFRDQFNATAGHRHGPDASER